MAHQALPLPCLMMLIESTLRNGAEVDPVVTAALNGGVDVIQLRDRASLPDDLRRAALNIRDLTRGRAKIIINDAPEIAEELRLDGIHLPEPAFDIDRTLISWPFVSGRSVHSVETARRAQDGGADYIIAGNIYETNSHPGKDGQGLDFLKAICEAVTIPVLAIGGITPENLGDCIFAGASGVAIRSGIVQSKDPKAAAQEYRAALNFAWERHAQ